MTLGGTPYPSIAMQQLYSCLKEGYRMEAPDNCPQEVYDVMVACWQVFPFLMYYYISSITVVEINLSGKTGKSS